MSWPEESISVIPQWRIEQLPVRSCASGGHSATESIQRNRGEKSVTYASNHEESHSSHFTPPNHAKCLMQRTLI